MFKKVVFLMLNKKIISVLLIGLIVFNGLAFAAPSGWAKDSYYSLKYEGVMAEGLTVSRLFGKNITREEFIELLMKVYLDAKGRSAQSMNAPAYFTDTNNQYVAYAYSLGVVNGVGENKFAPNQNVTRQEMTVMMKNILKALGYAQGSTPRSNFNDRNQMASWAIDAIDYCSSKGIINGMGDGRFAPLANATREQAFKLVDNLYQQFALKENFNRSLPTKSLGEFLVYGNEQTDLDYYLNQGRLVIISKGISDFGEAVNIKEDHYQVYRILETNENVPFQVIDKVIGKINDLYDPVAQRYLEATLYYDLTTGQLSENSLKPGIRIESGNDLKITVKLY